MSQAEKAALWRELKERGVEFPLHYREYSQSQLEESLERVMEAEVPTLSVHPVSPAVAQPAAAPQPRRVLPRREPDKVAGLRLNTHAEDEPLRVDENGLIWYQDEVRKAAFPKPRGRR